jgi:hypothetical protein
MAAGKLVRKVLLRVGSPIRARAIEPFPSISLLTRLPTEHMFG